MSYASVTYATIGAPSLPSSLPSLAPHTVRALRRALRRMVTLTAFALQSLGFAAALWMILAGPGLMTGH